MELRVLLVEDDDDDCQLICELAAEIPDVNVKLIREADYDSGLKTLINENVQVCLVDFRIGSHSGLDFVRRLKAIGCNIPLIILTGAGERELEERSLVAGAANYVDKAGLDAEHLGRVLRYATRPHNVFNIHDSIISPNEIKELETAAGYGHQSIDMMRVLMIEDDEDDYLLTKDLLVDIFGKQLQLEWVQSWREGLDRVFEARHDVVIVDYRLGERNGLELVREAVHLGCNMPFIVLTGEGNREIDLEAMHAGATDYLVKGEISGPLLDRSIRYAIERRKAERHLAEMAQIDQLTGLANRYRFREFLDRSIARANRQGSLVALMLIDLNRFKAVNDTYGHAAGDILLQEVATRLRRSVRPGDLVARLGGDEFTIVMSINHSDSEYLGSTAERLLEELRQPIDIGRLEVEVGASVGIAVYPSDADCADSIIISADTAMYTGKDNRLGSFHFYTPEMHQRATHRLQLERNLKLAVKRKEFDLFFQPQVDSRSGRLLGFESLLRWHHPELGLIAPDDFIQLAEESSLIIPIGEWVLETACAQLAAWRNLGLPEVHVAVNFSARQFQDAGLVDLVSDTLAQYSLPPHLLEIEITENDILKQPAEAHRLLKAFASLGIRVALDDFGTGYSSLNHLRAFPGAIIKIDRSFIRDIETASSNRAIVQSLIAMAHDLDLKVVAEGVENEAQLRYLQGRDCDIIQGYLISKPLPANAIGPRIFDMNLVSINQHQAAYAV